MLRVRKGYLHKLSIVGGEGSSPGPGGVPTPVQEEEVELHGGGWGGWGRASR